MSGPVVSSFSAGILPALSHQSKFPKPLATLSNSLPNSRPKPIVIVLIIGAIMALFSAWRMMSQPPENIPWRKSLADAKKESASTGRPILAYFTASWCGPCQQMRKETWADARVQAALAQWVVVKIEVDSDDQIAREFGVSAIPRLQMIDAKGEPGAARIGFTSADELLRWLRTAKSESTMGG
jgi:thiol:disulfide interchange protein